MKNIAKLTPSSVLVQNPESSVRTVKISDTEIQPFFNYFKNVVKYPSVRLKWNRTEF